MSSGQEGKDPRCVGCKDYHKSDYDYPCKVCAHIDANMAKDWYEAYTIKPVFIDDETPSKLKLNLPDSFLTLKKKTEEQEYLDELINDHWDYIQSVLEQHQVNKYHREIAEFHYRTAAKHFWKHAMEYVKEGK